MRLHFIDFARGVAICLALFSHIAFSFDLYQHLNHNISLVLKYATASATTTFIFLFGAMLELVYLPKLRELGRDKLGKRFMRRALMCWLGAMSGVFVLVIHGKQNAIQFFAALALIRDVRLNDILIFYCLALILAPFLLQLRIKIGLPKLLALALIVWSIAYLLPNTEKPPIFSWQHVVSKWSGLVLGFPKIQRLHSLPLYFFPITIGMFIGKGIAEWKSHDNSFHFYLRLAVVLGISALSAAAISRYHGGVIAVENFASGLWRWQMHYGYYAFSMFNAAFLLLLSSLIIKNGPVTKLRQKPFIFLGRFSLPCFSLGNAFILLLGLHLHNSPYNSIFVLLAMIPFQTILVCSLLAAKKRRSRSSDNLRV